MIGNAASKFADQRLLLIICGAAFVTWQSSRSICPSQPARQLA